MTLNGPQKEALEEFLRVFDGMVLSDIGPHLSCTEANVFASFIREFGHPDRAAALIDGHAESDEKGDDERHLAIARNNAKIRKTYPREMQREMRERQ